MTLAYNNKTQYPKTYIQVADINQTAQTVFAAVTGESRAISHIVISNNAGATKTAIFRAVDNTPEVVRVVLLTGTSIVIPGWRTDVSEGLEVIDTGNNTAGMYCTVFYVT